MTRAKASPTRLQVCLFLIVLLSPMICRAQASPPDSTLYARLLQRHVHQGLVDYRGVQEDRQLLDRYLDVLAEVNPDALERNAQLAFYINAYNAWTIQLVLTRYPNLKSIKDIGGWFSGPWDQEIARINGRTLTLDQIEHDIIRPKFRDSRIHFAVNCASMGCPPLRAEPYRGEVLNAQLDDQCRKTINDPARTRIEGNDLFVNKVFDWFGEDFPEGVLPFILKYAEGELKDRLLSGRGRIRIRYLEWDWSLNDFNRKKGA